MTDIKACSIADRHNPVFGLNLVRAFAILYVLIDHTLIFDGEIYTMNTMFIRRYIVAPDACLFFMLSGALLMPVSGSYTRFLKKRFVRVLIPFIIWSAIYALLTFIYKTGDTGFLIFQIKWSLLTPTFSQGWFIPALIGIYLFMPVISPWIKNATRRQLEYFLIVWLLAGTLPLMHVYMGADDFNNSIFGLFYNYLGYAVAGYYFVRHPVSRQNTRRTTAFIAGFLLLGIIIPSLIIFGSFNADACWIISSELSICTMGLGCLLFMTISRVRTLGQLLDPIVNLIATNAFGIFLCHMALQKYLFQIYLPELYGTPANTIILTVAALLVTTILHKIPFIGRFLSGR